MARYLVPGGTGNWNSTTNWSATSGGAPGASFPVVTDDVIIDANSMNANITVNVGSACLSLTIANTHTGTMTFTNTLAVAGNITLGSSMTTAGAGVLAISANGTITSNGTALNGTLTMTTNATTVTLADNWTVGGLTFSITGATLTVNGNTITNSGGMSVHTAGNRQVVGTTNIILNGTGNWTAGSNSGLHLNLTINTAGTITVAATVNYGTSTFTYTAGTVNWSTGTLQTRSSCTLNVAGISFFNVTTAAATQTLTLNSNLVITGTLSLASNTTFAGTGVWTVPNFNLSTSLATARQVTLKAGSTYTVTNSMEGLQGTRAAHSHIQSDTPGTMAILTLSNPITQKNIYLDVTDIDSSAGATGWTVDGTVSNCLNWNTLPTQPATITYSN